MDKLIRDLRHAVRMLLKTPVFTVVVVFTLAVGIGANTAMFSIVNGVLLQGLPFKHAERIVDRPAQHLHSAADADHAPAVAQVRLEVRGPALFAQTARRKSRKGGAFSFAAAASSTRPRCGSATSIRKSADTKTPGIP